MSMRVCLYTLESIGYLFADLGGRLVPAKRHLCQGPPTLPNPQIMNMFPLKF